MLSHTKNTEVLIHVIKALGMSGDRETANILLPFLRHEDFRVRLRAVHTIQRLGDTRYMTEIEAYADEALVKGERNVEYAKGDFPKKIYATRFRWV